MFGMVLGLGKPKGTINIQLERFNFHPGETIKGFLVLQVNEPIKARELCITFTGQEIKNTQQGMAVRNGTVRTGNASSTTTLIGFKQTLGGEKEYQVTPAPVTYPFEIMIPSDVLPIANAGPQISGVLGDALKLGQMFGALPTTKSTFYFSLTAKLDVPWSGDISKLVQINVVR